MNHLKCVIVAQKRILRVITYASRYERSLPLFVENKLLSYKYVFIYFTTLLMFKFVHHNYCADLFRRNIAVYNMRNNVNNVYIPLFRTTRCQKSIFFNGPRIWNSLPNDLKTIVNLHTFKYRLKAHLFHKQSMDLH